MAPAPPKSSAAASAAANAAAVHAAHAAAAAAAASVSPNGDQNRSLTVMIPRAKYYSQQTAPEPHSMPPHAHQHHNQHHPDRLVTFREI